MLSVVKINVPPSNELKAVEQEIEIAEKNDVTVIAHTSLGQSELIEDPRLSKMASYPVINGLNSDLKSGS